MEQESCLPSTAEEQTPGAYGAWGGEKQHLRGE